MRKYMIAPTVMTLVALVGCQAAVEEKDPASTPVEEQQGMENTETSTETECFDNRAIYETLLFGEPDSPIAYDGMAEYGHLLTLERVDKAEGEDTVFVYQGVMNDGYGDVDGTRSFVLTYTLTEDTLIESITNRDPQRKFEDERLLNSIIPNKVILKGALKTGTTWTETFEYEGKSYQALNELTIQMTEEGKTRYQVDTIVENISGFMNETYKEVRVFEEGLGLVSFTNTLPLDYFGEDYQAEYTEEEFYLFGYSRSAEVQ